MFKVTFKNKQGIKVVGLEGDLTSDNIKLIRDNLIKEDTHIRNYIFDLEKLELIDSTGLGYIIGCLKTAMKNNMQIKLLHLNNQPKIIFEITRVTSLFEIFTSENEALSSFEKKGVYNESAHTNLQQTA